MMATTIKERKHGMPDMTRLQVLSAQLGTPAAHLRVVNLNRFASKRMKLGFLINAMNSKMLNQLMCPDLQCGNSNNTLVIVSSKCS